MGTSHPRVLWPVLCVALLLTFLLPSPAWAQNTGGTLRGQVTDPSGAAVAGATVLLTTPSGASINAAANKDGFYEFKNLAPGKYQLKAVAQGFALFSKDNVVITAGQEARVNISLTIQEQQEKVEVNASTAQVDVNPGNNANSITLQGKDLEALSDDPDEMESELQALAGPSAGPNGGQIYIDGFTAGQLPPKASIREIRINQNPFSTEYDKLGYGRIEIFTKPGTDKFHGQMLVDGNTASFNARNPFELLPEGTSTPGYHSEQYSGNIGGPLSKKASFFFNIDHRDIGALGVVSARVICDDPYLLIPCAPGQAPLTEIPYSQAVSNPQTRTNFSPRIDYQLTPNNTLTTRYQYFRDSETNSGVGQFELEGQASNTLETEHTFQLTDTQTVNPSTINEIRFQYIHDDTLTKPVSTNISLNVGGAFNGLGSGGGTQDDVQNHYEFQNILYKTFTRHSLKIGGRFRTIIDANSNAQNFTGQFTFGSRPSPSNPTANCTANALASGCITPIEAYQITLQGLASGLTIPQIQALGGGASYYAQTAGVPLTSVTVIDLGLFAQDDWKLRRNLTFSYGLRYETQNHLANTVDLAPRLGMAWGIGGSGKNAPKTVLRAGYGIFYDRFTYNLLLQQQRFNLNAPVQTQYLIPNPGFFLSGNPNCVPPLPVPIPPACGSATGSETIDYKYNPNLHAPYTMQTGVTLERQLTKISNIAFTYLNSRGVHQFYVDNINPANPAIAATATNPIFQYQSEGIFKQNQFIVNGSIRMGAKLSLFGYYTLNYADSDTAGPSTLISIPGEPWKDYGRASFDIRNRIFFGGTVGLPYAFRLSPFMIFSSGVPFNITTGTDPFLDQTYNVRPEFAPCTPTTQTKFGCFAIPAPAQYPTYTPIPTYYGEGPGRFALMLRLSKTFGFGPVVEAAGNAGSGGPGGGTFGRPTRGGGGGGGGGRGGGFFDSGATNRRYAVTFGVMARNVFNNVNVLPLIGNLGSPLFGEPNGLVGRPYSDPSSNRRIDLQVTFSF
ncbi:MAG TPA: carboxypeptidase regulatory-like domain-containing protein [Candidatus Eremiobacteraceae bacterium]|nr:carboxypeptidase regulatory-like domain-containing protein [Candidatus Eremiobacteraceae bacterium]